MNSAAFEIEDPLGRFRSPALLVVGAVAYGTAGYMLVEGWILLDAFYLTVTTITTVGFGEIHPLSTAGRLFTATLVIRCARAPGARPYASSMARTRSALRTPASSSAFMPNRWASSFGLGPPTIGWPQEMHAYAGLREDKVYDALAQARAES